MRTISAAQHVDRLFTQGRSARHPLLVAIAIETAEPRDPQGRVVFVAGKRLGGAVSRNRAKRVLREAARRAAGPWAGWDVALVARAGTGSASPAELDAALSSALRRLGVVSP